MLFFRPMYLRCLDICYCRCLCGNHCICNTLIFAIADALFRTDVSATYFSLNLQILFNLPAMYNCIYILPFPGLEDTTFANTSSASHVFYDLRMLSIKILHLQLALSTTCRYSPSKLCIFNPRKFHIADTFPKYPLHSFYFMYWAIHDLQKNWYKKFERIWNERWWHLERKFLR